jgi:hypothetical protein
MTAQLYQSDSNADFGRLMKDGRAAFNKGELKLAHDRWRQAAMIEPYNEQVWLALLDVLDKKEDRRVCLQNILSINPMNIQARRMLRVYETEDQRETHKREKTKQRAKAVKRQRWVLVRRAVLMGILLGITGIVFAIVLSILLYG